MAKSGGTLKASFSTKPAVSPRPVQAPRVRRQDRIFPIPATKEVKPAKVADLELPKAPKIDVGKPVRPKSVPALKVASPKMDTKGFK